ncbi:MAG: nucleotidyl transferase AbiEii/AbiGii toxin family protein [Aliarcobacter sp.]|jgi:predicted nucleotidyltransferase component of viral defense system|nr:nucleotidyl transferase AbiEii/AbiGii toxin family protein [Aliarcobacter sp.]
MHRDNWDNVFENQDKILKQLKPLENEIFLAGGTGLQRFVLPQTYRHSEDLDFFFTSLKNKEEIDNIKNKILELMSQIPDAKLENIKWIKDEKPIECFIALKEIMKL